jgi:NDP-sugar pyrophosphorylase family protein
MKAIILAAGRGTRLTPITDTIPKPMISIAGRPILEHTIENIYTQVDEIIIVVKYLSENISNYF